MSDLSLDPVEGVLLVLEGGAATGTNKFGLLLALIDLAPEVKEGGLLPVEALVERMIDIHWEHARPFNGEEPLAQVTSSNRSSTLIQQIRYLQAAVRSNLPFELARQEITSTAWDDAVAAVRRDLLRNPLARLQNLPGAPPPFLYELVSGRRTSIRFLPGAAEALTRFGTALRPLIESRFIRLVMAANAQKNAGSFEEALGEHLFGSQRRMPSQAMRHELWEIQERRCVFTRKSVNAPSDGRRTVAVDHVVPWARYRISAIENFVLTSTTTNSSKRDFLLAPKMLERWVDHLDTNLKSLQEIAVRHGWPSDLHRVLSAAEHLYLGASTASPMWNGSGAECVGSIGKDNALNALARLR